MKEMMKKVCQKHKKTGIYSKKWGKVLSVGEKCVPLSVKLTNCTK